MESHFSMSPAIDQLATALAKAQESINDPSKNKMNTFYKDSPAYKGYADLESVLSTVRETLSKNNLAVTQAAAFNTENRHVSVTTVLMHTSGQWILSTLELPVAKERDCQSIGSAISYARRYSLTALIGVAQADDDGNDASGKQSPPPKKDTPSKTDTSTVEGAINFARNQLTPLAEKPEEFSSRHKEMLANLDKRTKFSFEQKKEIAAGIDAIALELTAGAKT